MKQMSSSFNADSYFYDFEAAPSRRVLQRICCTAVYMDVSTDARSGNKNPGIKELP